MADLEHVTEDWQRALAVVAHPDDMEFGAAAAVARWTRQGKHVVYCLLTSGEAGIDGIPPAETGPLREAEQLESCRLVGVHDVEFLHQPDGVLQYGLHLRRLISEQVRRHRPDIVITNNVRDTWEGGGLNQADHVATGRATLDAVRDAGNRWVFPEQLGDGREPWNGVRQVWLPGSPLAAHAVDVTTTMDDGVASLQAHRAYLDGLGWDTDVAGFLRESARATGERLGVPYATGVEVLDLGW
ncbi:PIG-L deacetylase family protein [Georgenia sp. H159]|uniref:PIG-L deacetylase family protein n=1 Tax=Georgenia sp. H159 TaxID=3076115 RepID=UPI002D782599|nr:PIG-L deacetylase family protein [Georgenia sp. H159]